LSQTNPVIEGPDGTTVTIKAENLFLDVTNSIEFKEPIVAPAFYTKTGSATVPVGPSITPIGLTFTTADSGIWTFSVKVPQPTGPAFTYQSLWTVIDLGTALPPGVGPMNTTNRFFEFDQNLVTGQVLTGGEVILGQFVGAYNSLFVDGTPVEINSGFPLNTLTGGTRDYYLRPFYEGNGYVNPIEMEINATNLGTTLNWSLTKLSAF
jgi:hypothetical protein